ncbi:hypothetical protein BHR43_17680 [Aeromonas salmonicida subsp. salmonicida]|nr:hypothetical protein [Aeromonas salmonicida]KHE97374.1 hypothetical protein NX85_17615 [Aeromonas salmonicida subsp. salmonicida]KHE98655.1 hypothetical protein NV17_08210 [Aeromonas salmonicida subsp. salmonicida]OKA85920.1 hypothetical protein BHR43_17680 [Aeromonas salmonicida subsp. salmonicida]OKA88497.1 hypothetical protein BHR44_05960 [Aeromonas salmonicida subsp. salmonicida]OKA91208.1 hypothetical protein BHR45_06215 [Aeromonas salmonicida subsp. salmonicida]
MSHFAVMVIGQNVENQLAPYHEFECTGTVDQYVQTIDRLPSLLEDYAKDTHSMLRGPEGELVSAYDDRFYREKTEEEKKGKTHLDASSKIRFVPEGWTEQEVVVNEFMSLVDFIKYQTSDGFPFLQEGDELDLLDEHKWGWARVNAAGEVIEYTDRTNPNKQWDWYQIGGRWSGFLKLKQDAAGSLGHQGLMGSCANDGEGRADSALKSAIDFEGMRDEAGAKAATNWDKAAEAKIAAGLPADSMWEPWDVVRERHPGNIDAARDEYHAQGAMQAVKKALNLWDGTDKFLTPRDEFIQQARDSALVLFGVVQDSKWFAKGEMGWFGMSTDDMTQAEWNRKVNELLDELPDDTLITIVDCHI